LGFFNASLFFFISASSLGKKRFLIHKNKNNIKTIMAGEIIRVGICCFGMTMFGLALGFVFLQVQANT
jgi:hypothetical protein